MLSWIIIREQIMTVGRHNVNHHKAWKLSIRLGREGDQPEDASTGGAKTSLIYKPLWPWGSIQTLRMRPFSTLSAEYCPVSGGKVCPEGNGKEAETLCTFLQYILGYLHFKGRLKIRGKNQDQREMDCKDCSLFISVSTLGSRNCHPSELPMYQLRKTGESVSHSFMLPAKKPDRRA